MSLTSPKRCCFQSASPPETIESEANVFILVHLLDDDSQVSVLRNTLIFHSGHFAELLDDDPERRVVAIPGIPLPLFIVIESWLRTGTLLPIGDCLSYMDAVTLYTFGDTYAMPRIRNSVIDLVFATIFREQLFPVSTLNEVYNQTAPGCSLRRLLVDIAIVVYNWEDLVLKSERLPKEFLLEVLRAIQGKTIRLGGPIMFSVEAWQNTMMESLCVWHEHVEPGLDGIELTGHETENMQFALHYPQVDSILDEPEDVDSNERWHSALVMRSR